KHHHLIQNSSETHLNVSDTNITEGVYRMINLFLLVTASTLFFTGISLIISYLIYKKAENHTSKAIGLAVSSFLTLLTLFVTLSFSFV
ncbi:hypothetical protein N2G57_14505, partial [Enterococcus faecium]|nr:hypothetical protein [Enterococcus faecium]